MIALLLTIVDAKDDMVKDMLLDMAIGGGLEICSKYNTCRVALRLITVAFIIAYLLNWMSRVVSVSVECQLTVSLIEVSEQCQECILVDQ